MWGPSIQLYTLRTPHNWGIGDFGDLKQLVSELASRGADFVGLNPIHALFPANPEAASPYSPSSRRWLNLLYIDVSAVREFSLSAKAQQLVGSAAFQRRLQTVRDAHWVDYSEVAALKMAVLPLLFEEFKQRELLQQTRRGRAFLDFIELGGESLKQQATFDALHQHLRATDEALGVGRCSRKNTVAMRMQPRKRLLNSTTMLFSCICIYSGLLKSKLKKHKRSPKSEAWHLVYIEISQ